MKVLQINAVSGIRSTGRICVEISDYLNSIGHEGYIAYSDGPVYEKGYKIGTTFEKKIHAFFSRLLGTQAYFSKKGTRKLLKFMDSIKPDVVQLRNLHGNFINFKLFLDYCSEKDIAVVITMHDCWYYTGKCTHYTVDKCYKWKTGCGNCPRLKKDNISWFFDRTKKMLNDKKKLYERIPRLAVVGGAQWITDEAKLSILSNAKIITRIYEWIDLDVFKPVDSEGLKEKLNLKNKFIVLGVASIWANSKGFDKFLEISRKINDDMIIILVGKIKSQIDLPKNIIHIDETHDVNELIEFYSMADVLLNLSSEEGFGKVSAEALACGTPLIANRSTANPELVGPGCGFILEDLDPENIIEALNIVKNHKKEFFSENCINFAKNNFKKQERLNDFVNLFQSLIDLKKS